MTLQDVIDEIRLELTGGVLELEIDDITLKSVVSKALRELERYWDETTMITVPFCSCIDLSGFNSSVVVKVYRTEAVGDTREGSGLLDPVYAQQWLLFSNGGTMYNLNDYVLNYAAWNTLNQIKNTLSTDLAFKEDTHNKKLYINQYMSTPERITIEYIPKLTSVDDIKSDYWQDILIQLSVALTKIVLGRIRTRFTQSSALWTQDGDKMLDEGNTALTNLRERLNNNSNLIYPIGSGGG